MTPTEMEMRVAKRIGAYYGLHGSKNVQKHINVARAAIRAMREPTADMVEAGGVGIAIDCQGFSHAAKIGNYSSPEIMSSNMMKASAAWQAIINAASPTTDGDK